MSWNLERNNEELSIKNEDWMYLHDNWKENEYNVQEKAVQKSNNLLTIDTSFNVCIVLNNKKCMWHHHNFYISYWLMENSNSIPSSFLIYVCVPCNLLFAIYLHYAILLTQGYILLLSITLIIYGCFKGSEVNADS